LIEINSSELILNDGLEHIKNKSERTGAQPGAPLHLSPLDPPDA
jgi:hypothetical protein